MPCRVHALYVTDKVCSQPLTPMLHLSDMRWAVVGYTEALVRTFKALVLGIQKLQSFYARFSSEAQPSGVARDAELEKGIPYMLRNR